MLILVKEISANELLVLFLSLLVAPFSLAMAFFLVLSPRHPRSTFFQPRPFSPPPPQKKNSKKQCIRDTDDPRKCKALRDDYLECLHHRKEIARLNAVYREQKKADAAAAAAGGDKGGAAAADKKH